MGQEVQATRPTEGAARGPASAEGSGPGPGPGPVRPALPGPAVLLGSADSAVIPSASALSRTQRRDNPPLNSSCPQWDSCGICNNLGLRVGLKRCGASHTYS